MNAAQALTDFAVEHEEGLNQSSALQVFTTTGNRWKNVVKELRSWLDDPSRMEVEGAEPPSRGTVRLAIEVAKALEGIGWVAPKRVLPDGDRGIAFEHRSGSKYEILTLAADGTLLLERFESARLVDRTRLNDLL